ncbi:MAG TPA: ANTAR domain-containing protein [Mycobacterium sp.]|nr:ANTAR domain-containing protein [Mycobacterium sp.]
MGSDSNDPLAVAPADPATVFTAFAEIIYQGAQTSDVYAAICVAATLLVPGCDHASVLVRHKGEYITVAASDAIARRVDALERETGDGPCLDAIEEEGAQAEPDLRAAQNWPTLAARVLAETPVRGAMGFRLLVDDRKVGALNLFSDTPNRFDHASIERAIVLAAFATVAINSAAKGEDVAMLRQGLLSNREIGKAVGMMMLLHDVSHDEAFEMLRHTSQDLNIKLADVARVVIERRGQLPPPGRSSR